VTDPGRLGPPGNALGETERAEVQRPVLAAMADVRPMRTPAIFAVARKLRG
jgi:hypothetical protein